MLALPCVEQLVGVGIESGLVGLTLSAHTPGMIEVDPIDIGSNFVNIVMKNHRQTSFL